MAIKGLSKIPKWIRIGTLILILGASGYAIFIMSLLSVFGSSYSKKDLVRNFERKKGAILTLKRYFNSIVPKNEDVEIEFRDNNNLFRLGVSSLNSVTGATQYPIFLDWNLAIGSRRLDSIIATIGWTEKTLHEIKKKLDAADCIAIHNGEPAVIGFKRSGMGMYLYNVFDSDVLPEQRRFYNDSCRYILYNNRVVLEYGGGAAGPQCFPRSD